VRWTRQPDGLVAIRAYAGHCQMGWLPSGHMLSLPQPSGHAGHCHSLNGHSDQVGCHQGICWSLPQPEWRMLEAWSEIRPAHAMNHGRAALCTGLCAALRTNEGANCALICVLRSALTRVLRCAQAREPLCTDACAALRTNKGATVP